MSASYLSYILAASVGFSTLLGLDAQGQKSATPHPISDYKMAKLIVRHTRPHTDPIGQKLKNSEQIIDYVEKHGSGLDVTIEKDSTVALAPLIAQAKENGKNYIAFTSDHDPVARYILTVHNGERLINKHHSIATQIGAPQTDLHISPHFGHGAGATHPLHDDNTYVLTKTQISLGALQMSFEGTDCLLGHENRHHKQKFFSNASRSQTIAWEKEADSTGIRTSSLRSAFQATAPILCSPDEFYSAKKRQLRKILVKSFKDEARMMLWAEPTKDRLQKAYDFHRKAPRK